ncbi:MAG: RES family NAD+ phosphorylase [Tetrasphaera jenkinsii]|uniref:RES domain-containing protein n=1 Tax=Nostocoides jenkinsii Ben 74 TaxID=1193518 RepID=A0A077M998_9MICO|nr:RES domain-containing protein [Tetrasphaera jenkinsii]MCI1261294.1 RES family NAD+ phosphorylase [Tetrasphaera jenkinsii]CCI53234.1 conserved hypothetical protein [Tetrasphaera jenkinsii Ben 74]
MLLYRVFPYLPGASPGEPGSPTYLHRPQGRNRLDNQGVYDTWYFGLSPAAAIGEVFGDFVEWSAEMFLLPALPGSVKALGIYEVDDDIGVLDLDDARNLLARGLRPTQVIGRNRPVTQEWALSIYREQKWAGVRWWSYQRPHWTIYCLWVPVGDDCPATFLRIDDLDTSHPSVVDAANSLGRPIA